MKAKSLILHTSLFLIPTLSYAWEAKGHSIIATIASNLLNKNVRDSLEEHRRT